MAGNRKGKNGNTLWGSELIVCHFYLFIIYLIILFIYFFYFIYVCGRGDVYLHLRACLRRELCLTTSSPSLLSSVYPTDRSFKMLMSGKEVSSAVILIL